MELDANVGKVMDSIREAGIDKDTIVVFTSDNGAWIDAWPDAGYSTVRGMKGTAFEGGWRVASTIWAPGRIQPGTVLNGMMSHMDIWPTTAAMAGLTPPPHGEWKDNDGKPIYFDGIDNSAYVTGKPRSLRGSRGSTLKARISWQCVTSSGNSCGPPRTRGSDLKWTGRALCDVQPSDGSWRELRHDLQRRRHDTR
jgi:arylsulfatase A-like enzyme